MSDEFELDKKAIARILANHTQRGFRDVLLSSLLSFVGWFLIFMLIGLAVSDAFSYLVQSIVDNTIKLSDFILLYSVPALIASLALALVKTSDGEYQDWSLFIVYFLGYISFSAFVFIGILTIVEVVAKSGKAIASMWLIRQRFVLAIITIASLVQARFRWIKLIDDPVIHLLESLLNVHLDDDNIIGNPTSVNHRVRTTIEFADGKGNSRGVIQLPFDEDTILDLFEEIKKHGYTFKIRDFAGAQGMITDEEWAESCKKFVRARWATKAGKSASIKFTDWGEQYINGVLENGFEYVPPAPSDSMDL